MLQQRQQYHMCLSRPACCGTEMTRKHPLPTARDPRPRDVDHPHSARSSYPPVDNRFHALLRDSRACGTFIK